jgi:class 3 adenylate cyclase
MPSPCSTGAVPDPSYRDEAPDDLSLLAPSLADDPSFRSWWQRAGQRGASPAAARTHLRMLFEADLRELLPSIRVPTLVLHRPRNRVLPIGNARYLADHLGGPTVLEQVPGTDFLLYGDDADAAVAAIEVFLTGHGPTPAADRVLTTLLFTDIVESTAQTGALGDARWRARLDRHDDAVRGEIRRFGGHEVNTTGDGFVVTFDGPARAIHCGCAMLDAARGAGVDLRVGVHTGEVERRGEDVTGAAVNLAARICALAEPGEVLVSSTVADLAEGSGIEFVDRGIRPLKGVDRSWRTFTARAPTM